MAETAPTPAVAETAGKKKQKAKKPAAVRSRPAKSGPSVSELIVNAVAASKERSGVSLAALKKALAASGYDVDKNNSRLKIALKGLVSKETLIQLKGSGASGSFKINKKQLESKAKVAKKVTAAKPKKAAPTPKKVAAKSPKKPKKAPAGVKKSPKKVKKPAPAVKKPAKSPKKPAKSPKKLKAVKPKKTSKSPAKRAVKPKPGKSPAKAKKAAPKK